MKVIIGNTRGKETKIHTHPFVQNSTRRIIIGVRHPPCLPTSDNLRHEESDGIPVHDRFKIVRSFINMVSDIL